MSCEFIPSLRDTNTCKVCGAPFSKHKHPREAAPLRVRNGRSGPKRRLPPDQETSFVDWYRRYKAMGTCRSKAKELNISITTLKNILLRHGVRS